MICDRIPVISVCIANYNGAGLAEACIDSVLAQDFPQEVEIIVHDDASTDGSADLISAVYPQVRLLRSAENVGFCVANNRMVAEARGGYVLLLNNDAVLFKDALASLYSEAKKLQQQAILSLPQYAYEGGELIDNGCLLDPFFNPVPNLDLRRRDVAMVIGACLWLPKKLWEELGAFPEWFESIAEDMYLCCRARLSGYPVLALGESGYRHRAGASFSGDGRARDGQFATTFRRRALSERNKTFVMAMICPIPFVQMVLPLHLMLLFIEGALLSILRGRTTYLRRIYLPVFAALFRRRSQLRVGRSAIMKNRHLASADFFSVFDPLPYKLRMLIRYGLPVVRG